MSAITLSDVMIDNRRTAYACCAGNAGYEYVQALIYGDKECQKKWRVRLTWLLWARDAMMRTAKSTEDPLQKCFSHDDACIVIQKADAICKTGCKCCGTEDTPVVPVDCSITADYTVDRVVSAGEVAWAEATFQTIGYTYYVVSTSGGTATPGQIGSWDGSQWLYLTLSQGDVVLDSSTSLYWVNGVYPQLPGAMFPPIDVDTDETGTYTLESRFPWVASGSTRTVVVEMSTDGSVWDQLFAGPESDLATPYVVTVAEQYYYQVRVTYDDGPCTYQYYDGLVTVQPNPPLSNRSLEVVGFKTLSADYACSTFQHPLTEDWTHSFKARIINGDFFIVPAVGVTMADQAFSWILSIEFAQDATFAPFYNVSIQVNADSSFAAGVAIIPKDDEWHTITVKREATTPYGMVFNTDLILYVDGAPVSITPSTPPITYGPQAPMEKFSFSTRGGGQNFIRIDEMYHCAHPVTDSEALNIVVPNLMDGSDGTWGRRFYYRVEQTDVLPSIQSLAPPSISVLTAPNDGSATLSTDVDPNL